MATQVSLGHTRVSEYASKLHSNFPAPDDSTQAPPPSCLVLDDGEPPGCVRAVRDVTPTPSLSVQQR